MKHTKQQQTIIDYITKNTGLVKVNAVAGAGKTTLLAGIAKALKPSNGLYLAYNKSIATESQSKFPKEIKCRTTHSLAYQATVKPFKLWLGHFTYREITEKISYPVKVDLLEYMRQYCLSEYTSFAEFAKLKEGITDFMVKLVNKYLELMSTGEIQCTHDFYLKYFHLLLANNEIEYDKPFDIIMLDESGDLNPVTLEIFKLLPATRKVMVGDQYQNIYTFNHTINCFKEMENEGALFPMTQSFRVSESIAERIQQFCRDYIDPNMEFKGIPMHDSVIKTKAFIARTNGQLVAHMMELNQNKIEYSLARTAQSIFRVPLLLCGLKPNSIVADPEYNHLQDDVDNYYEDPELRKEKTLLSYIKDVHEDDITLQSAVTLVQNYGKSDIIKCFEMAKKYEKKKTNYMVCSAHSSKGLEFDSVTIADDLNKGISKIIEMLKAGIPLEKLTPDEIAEINLYYVACSRAKKQIHNARYLKG